MTDEILAIKGLYKRFGDKTALKNINLTLHKGELFTLLGPNGAGKTTLLKILSGLIRTSEGTVLLLNRDVQHHPIEAKQNTCFIPDHPDLYERLTGWEYLSFIAGTYKLDKTKWKERADELLAFFELTDLACELIQTFSHGMRQRLCFTAAFLPAPRLLLIDEPWTGLDPKHLKRAITALQNAAKEGTVVILSTHSLSLAEEIGGRIGILHKGTLLWDGPQHKLTGEQQNLEEVFLELTGTEE